MVIFIEPSTFYGESRDIVILHLVIWDIWVIKDFVDGNNLSNLYRIFEIWTKDVVSRATFGIFSFFNNLLIYRLSFYKTANKLWGCIYVDIYLLRPLRCLLKTFGYWTITLFWVYGSLWNLSKKNNNTNGGCNLFWGDCPICVVIKGSKGAQRKYFCFALRLKGV